MGEAAEEAVVEVVEQAVQIAPGVGGLPTIERDHGSSMEVGSLLITNGCPVKLHFDRTALSRRLRRLTLRPTSTTCTHNVTVPCMMPSRSVSKPPYNLGTKSW